jgi:hypothetical protein
LPVSASQLRELSHWARRSNWASVARLDPALDPDLGVVDTDVDLDADLDAGRVTLDRTVAESSSSSSARSR